MIMKTPEKKVVPTTEYARLREKLATANIVAYGELLVEVRNFDEYITQNHALTEDDIEDRLPGADHKERMMMLEEAKTSVLRTVATQKAKQGELHLAGDVFNMLENIKTIVTIKNQQQETMRAINTTLVGPIGTKGALGAFIKMKLGSILPWLEDSDKEQGIGAIVGKDNSTPLYDRDNGPIRDCLANEEIRAHIVETARKNGVFYTSTIAMGMTRNFKDFTTLLKEVKEAGVTIVLDTNYRPYVMDECFSDQNIEDHQDAFEQVLEHTDILLSGVEDLRKIYSSDEHVPGKNEQPKAEDPNEVEYFFELFKEKMPGKMIVIKQDVKGVSWLNEDGDIEFCKQVHNIGKHAIVKDKTGGGDSWNAAFLTFIMSNPHTSIMEAADFANRVAGAVVQKEGAVVPAHKLEPLLA